MNMNMNISKIMKLPTLNPLKHRRWIDLYPRMTSTPQGHTFKMMSFNMLNQSYMWPQVYDSYVPAQYQSWEYRVNLLRAIIDNEEIKSDLMCFQEMGARNYRDYWAPMLRAQGFQGEYIQKTKPVYWSSERDSDELDGVSIFYDTSKFEMLDIKKFQISKYFQEEFRNKYDLKLNEKQINTIFQTRNQVALMMGLRHLDTNEVIIVANTHLYWKYNDVKLLQVMVLLEALESFKRKFPSSAKVLFSGDFNSRPNSSVYKFFMDEKINTTDPDISKYLTERTKKYILNPVELPNNVFERIIHNQHHEHARTMQQDEDRDLFTCFTQHLFGIFDYIWFNERDFRLLKFLSGVDKDYIQSIAGLPNDEFPSDHIPLVAEFEIRA